MAKKLIIMMLSITMIACSSISVYATDMNDSYTTNATVNISAQDSVVAGATSETKQVKAKSKTTVSKVSKYKRGLAAYIRKINGNVSRAKSLRMAGYFIAKGNKYNLDAKVLMAIAQNESTFYTNATSPYGYKGLMQTSNALARRYGYKPTSLYKAEVSIGVGAKYLRGMKNRFKTYTKAISAYAYGSGSVSSGNYSNKVAYKMLKTRKQITSYLNRNNYI